MDQHTLEVVKIVLPIASAAGTGLLALYVDKRVNMAKDEMRVERQQNYVPREVIDARLDSINEKLKDIVDELRDRDGEMVTIIAERVASKIYAMAHQRPEG